MFNLSFSFYGQATAENGTQLQVLRTEAYITESIQMIQQCQNENQRKRARKESGVTEKESAFDSLFSFRGYTKTPVEILHTILLGPVRYLLKATIQSLSTEQKSQMHAKVTALDMKPFSRCIKGNITRNYGSYVGRDFKLWIQVAVFVLQNLIPDEDLSVWQLLSEVILIFTI